MAWLLVFLGGGLGSLCRFGLVELLPKADPTRGNLPWATLLANLLACLILGAGVALLSRNALSKELSFLLLTGFCGGFSTFSTFSGEVLGLYEAGYWWSAAGYLFVSLITGVAAVVIGLALMK